MPDLPGAVAPISLDPAILSSMANAALDALPHLPRATAEEIGLRRRAALQTIAALRPRDPVEAMLAARCVAAHYATMDALRVAAQPNQPVDATLRLRGKAIGLARMMDQTRRDLLQLQSSPAPSASSSSSSSSSSSDRLARACLRPRPTRRHAYPLPHPRPPNSRTRRRRRHHPLQPSSRPLPPRGPPSRHRPSRRTNTPCTVSRPWHHTRRRRSPPGRTWTARWPAPPPCCRNTRARPCPTARSRRRPYPRPEATPHAP